MPPFPLMAPVGKFLTSSVPGESGLSPSVVEQKETSPRVSPAKGKAQLRPSRRKHRGSCTSRACCRRPRSCSRRRGLRLGWGGFLGRFWHPPPKKKGGNKGAWGRSVLFFSVVLFPCFGIFPSKRTKPKAGQLKFFFLLLLLLLLVWFLFCLVAPSHPVQHSF